jgi:hypothetical protein
MQRCYKHVPVWDCSRSELVTWVRRFVHRPQAACLHPKETATYRAADRAVDRTTPARSQATMDRSCCWAPPARALTKHVDNMR